MEPVNNAQVHYLQENGQKLWLEKKKKKKKRTKCDVKRRGANKSDPNTHITGIYVFVCILVKENSNQFMFAIGW